jgi:hypothetical protein
MHRTRSSSGAAPPPSAASVPNVPYAYAHHAPYAAVPPHAQHRQHYQHHHQPQPQPTPQATADANNSASKTQECHICLEDLRAELVACPCGHVYHYECIVQALEVNKQCPICRGRATPSQLIRLFLEVPEPSAEQSNAHLVVNAQSSHEPQVAALNERLAVVIEALRWQKKQNDVVVEQLKSSRHQTEQLYVDKQTLLQRVGALETNKNELLSKVAKYQIELSRQAEAARQLAVNQSILNYLNTCDADALEDDVQNPRELVAALKKACKFRHDQYQKVVKEKAKLKAMVQTLQQQLGGGGVHHDVDDETSVIGHMNRAGKHKMKSPAEAKRSYSATEYTTSHPHEVKKRKVTISPAGGAAASASTSATASGLPSFAPRGESSTFRSSAYTDVAVRPLAATNNLPRNATGFARSNFNPNQYGSYNLMPSHEPPVQASDRAVCRRGYDETGKLTNYFIPKETKQRSSHNHAHAKSMTNARPYLGSASSHGTGNRHHAASATAPSRQQFPGDRRDYPLTNWLHKGQ